MGEFVNGLSRCAVDEPVAVSRMETRQGKDSNPALRVCLPEDEVQVRRV
jgi:hypothetical protein